MQGDPFECAIVGFAARYPGGRGVDAFWDGLRRGVSFIAPLPEDRRHLLLSGGGGDRVRHGVFLEEVDCFDRGLFSMSPPAAMFADPRQRLLLESCWSTFEDAGLRRRDVAGKRIGVFIGQDAWYWGAYSDMGHPEYEPAQQFILPGNNPAFLATRVSAAFDLQGPSLVFNATCSSVYVALHHACVSLARGECDYALVGGVTVFHRIPVDRFESPDPGMLSFQAAAAGYVSSEGCGTFLLCRNEPGLARRQEVHAVVRASACNSGGKTNSFAQPSRTQLVALIRETLAGARLSPSEIECVEAHGIASSVGDSIEAEALAEALPRSEADGPCVVSTVKPNIGHAHAASGVYSLIKCMLAMRHGCVPPIAGLGDQPLNPAAEAARCQLRFLSEPAPWPRRIAGTPPRQALLLSFGFSNLNAALILREPEEVDDDRVAPRKLPTVVCLSARSSAQLQAQRAELAAFVEGQVGRESPAAARVRLADIAHTLRVGREPFAHRWATVVSTLEELLVALRADAPRGGEPSNKAEQLVAAWRAGEDIEWAERLPAPGARLVHLPTYPFARERYWLPAQPAAPGLKHRESADAERATATEAAPISSTLRQVRIRLSGDEAFLKDHQLHGRPVLPGTAYLEIVRKAYCEVFCGSGTSVCLREITWLRPLIVAAPPIELGVRFVVEAPVPSTSPPLSRFEVYVPAEDLAAPGIVYATGICAPSPEQSPPPLDLAGVRAATARAEVSSEQCYQHYDRAGLRYGPSHRGIAALHVGDGQVLSHVQARDDGERRDRGFVLDPGLLDAAFQGFVAFDLVANADGAAAEAPLFVPYALGELRIFRALPPRFVCWLRRSSPAGAAEHYKVDLDLAEENGQICVEVQGLALRAWPTEARRVSNGVANGVKAAPLNGGGSAPPPAAARGPLHAVVREVMAEVLRVPAASLDTRASFKDLGMDSLLASTVAAALSKKVGPVAPTLFFEFPTIDELAGHLATLAPSAAPAPTTQLAAPQSVVVKKADLKADSENSRRVEAFGAASSQNSVLFDLWPELFVSPGGCLHVVQRQGRVFATGTSYARTNPDEDQVVEQLAKYCGARSLALCYLSIGRALSDETQGRCDLLSLPVGCFQTIEDLSEFGLGGRAMGRLRYMVQRFRKEKDARTEEYRGGDPRVDDQIRHVLLEWARAKKVVSNVGSVVTDLEQGRLTQRYRLFLTYVDSVLQNVVAILPIEGGYLMDQEYYLPTMPVGGIESGVVSLTEQLKSEGHRRFSLGLTWKRPSDEHRNRPRFDEAGAALIAGTGDMVGHLFDHGERNYQHKSKFRPSETGVFFYRPRLSATELIRRSLSEFLSTGLTAEQLEERIRHDAPPAALRPPTPAQALPPAPSAEPAISPGAKPDVRLDLLNLLSDSWPHHDAAFVRERMARLHVAAAAGGPPTKPPFGGRPRVMAMSGRLAERLFFRGFLSKRKTIVRNLPFETTSHNAERAGFKGIEIPDPAALDPHSRELFRGGIDVPRLERLTREASDEIALVFIELCNNASGGYPVALAQLRQVSALCRGQGLPLVLDITRIVRNAELIRRYEPAFAERDLWSIVEEIVGLATHCIGSLCKDFACDAGGIIVTADEPLLHAVTAVGQSEGGLAHPYFARLMLAAVSDRDYITHGVREQLDTSAEIHRRLLAAGAPVVSPGGGHCVLVRAGEIPLFAATEKPEAALLEHLLRSERIQGSMHFGGSGAAARGTAIDRCVRLAFPVGMPSLDTADRVVAALSALAPTPPPVAVSDGAPIVSPSARTRDGAPFIAIIGLWGRFAGARDPRSFWGNLLEGRDSVTEIPASRWDWRAHYDPDSRRAAERGQSCCRWGGFVDGHDFDPAPLGLAPEDTGSMDSQERMLLVAAWRALEDAGYNVRQLSAVERERTGVFAGVTRVIENAGAGRGSSFARLVNRISYTLDLHGPSIAIDSLCSSSLVAVHEACEYLRSGRGDIALAGAVNLDLDAASYARRTREGLLAAGSRTKPFEKGGTGYVPGEGVGVLVLKRLENATRDGDDVYAIIRGSAVNHSGRMNAFGVANPRQQAAVIRQALASAGVSAQTVGYVEAAASGVELADALELSALARVYGERRGDSVACRIGSLKGNIGHCEAAAGMSQMIKAIFSLKHGRLAPTLGDAGVEQATEPQLRVQREATEWPRMKIDGAAVPRRAGVSTVSAAGVNAHVILEEHDAAPNGNVDAHAHPMLFVLSAASRAALEAYADAMMAYLRDAGDHPPLSRIAFTLWAGRDAMNHRLAVIARNGAELAARVTTWRRSGQPDPDVLHGTVSDRPPTEAGRAGETGAADLRETARRWVQGLPTTWTPPSPTAGPRRLVMLPGYPFAAPSTPVDLASTTTEKQAPATVPPRARPGHDADRVYAVVTAHLRSALGLPAEASIDDNATFSDLGLGSRALVEMIDGVSRALSVSVRAIAAFDYPTVRELSAHLGSRTEDVASPATPPRASGTSADADLDSVLRAFVNGASGLEATLQRLDSLGSKGGARWSTP